MNLTIILESLQEDLQGVAELGDERAAGIARRLADSLGSNLRLKLLDVLSQAAVEVSSKLPSGHVEVRLAGQEPELVYVEERGGRAMPTGEDALSARVTLRLPETLKAIIDAAAQDEGVSANTWLLQQISRSANPKRRGPYGRRMTGYGRS